VHSTWEVTWVIVLLVTLPIPIVPSLNHCKDFLMGLPNHISYLLTPTHPFHMYYLLSKKFFTEILRENNNRLELYLSTGSSSYLGGRDQKDCGSKSAWGDGS
jgi:hypothetical protein